VQDIANVLIQKGDFIANAQDFVNQFTTYENEIGDYWGTPSETLAFRYGDCDDKAILLCSILRNYIPAEEVYCAVGLWRQKKTETGHMWVAANRNGGRDRLVEATAPSSQHPYGTYILSALFNDKYAFSTDFGLKEFVLLPVPLELKLEKASVAV
jgi:hypothetical protein